MFRAFLAFLARQSRIWLKSFENANTATKFLQKKTIRIPTIEEFDADLKPVDVCRELFHKT
jgi:hypothetical protein